MTDSVNSPDHYNQGGIECIDAIRAALTPEEFRGFCKGNVLKYIWREKNKGQDESLKKASWYIDETIKGNRMGEWCPWDGSSPYGPFGPGSENNLVEVRLRGFSGGVACCKDIPWRHIGLPTDIIAYRIVK